jgi:hypothetical protein
MIALITFFAFVLLTLALAFPLAEAADRRWVGTWMVLGWLVLFPLLVAVDVSFPFTGGGDDEYYFYLATMPLGSWVHVFDVTRFMGYIEQPGYPWLLAILYQFTGKELLALKVLNLAILVMLIPVWYRIGLELESRAFARTLVVVILLMTPLWYYGFFLLKDITITLFQSLFLLGLVRALRAGGRAGWVLILISTLGVLPFRSHLVLVNVAVICGSVALSALRRGQYRRTVAAVVMALIVTGSSLAVASSSDWMAAFGVSAEHRVLRGSAMIERALVIGETSKINRTLFPLLYVFSETSGLNPQTWVDFEARSLRGIFAIPWIFFGVPLFVWGILNLLARGPQATGRGGLIGRVQCSRLVLTPWSGVVVFILAFLAISWTLGDTTRWRLPDMPAMASIALVGWRYSSARLRMQLVMWWVSVCGSLFAAFYLLWG